MKQEEIFAAAEAAELSRVVTCCPGVENKLCSNDQWKGNLGPFAAEIERRTMERCIEFIRNGSFLHDDSPPARFAKEVTKEMERQLLDPVKHLTTLKRMMVLNTRDITLKYKEPEMTEVIKMERQDVTKLKGGELLWIQGEGDKKPSLLFVIAQVPDYEMGPRVSVYDTTTTGCTMYYEPATLQREHDVWMEKFGTWEVKPFDRFARTQVLYYAKERYDPARWVGWETIAYHVVREWPEFWAAYTAMYADESNDKLFRAFIDATELQVAKHEAEFPA
jgi:hypothetical protein